MVGFFRPVDPYMLDFDLDKATDLSLACGSERTVPGEGGERVAKKKAAKKKKK